MTHPFRLSLLSEYLWTPLVHIPKDAMAFLHHPGTKIKSQPLTSGWRWHWPFLTSIVVIRFYSQKLMFDSTRNTTDVANDGDITAVSRDHHLLVIRGQLTLGFDKDAESAILSAHNRHTEARLIRPILRQCIRSTVALYDAQECSINRLTQELQQRLLSAFTPHGIVISDLTISSASLYTPTITK